MMHGHDYLRDGHDELHSQLVLWKSVQSTILATTLTHIPQRSHHLFCNALDFVQQRKLANHISSSNTEVCASVSDHYRCCAFIGLGTILWTRRLRRQTHRARCDQSSVGIGSASRASYRIPWSPGA